MVFEKYYHRRHKIARHQGTARMRYRENAGLFCDFTGIWVGWGFGFHFWRTFELRPYFALGLEIPIVPDDDLPEDETRVNILGTLGCRFLLYIKYPFQFMVGVEYNANMSPFSLDDTPEDVRFCSTFSAYAGFRWCF